jgi:hypothetical protein
MFSAISFEAISSVFHVEQFRLPGEPLGGDESQYGILRLNFAREW